MKILWFDPGGVTGWATFECDEVDGPFGKEYYNGKFVTGQLEGENHHQKIESLIGLAHASTDYTVGYEVWHNQKNSEGFARDKVDWMACEYIGAIKLAYYNRPDPKKLVSQMPSQRKWADQRKMEVFGLWSLTAGRKDARSAAQHLLTYLGATLQHPMILSLLEQALNH